LRLAAYSRKVARWWCRSYCLESRTGLETRRQAVDECQRNTSVTRNKVKKQIKFTVQDIIRCSQCVHPVPTLSLWSLLPFSCMSEQKPG
jgi:hypothetical protein